MNTNPQKGCCDKCRQSSGWLYSNKCEYGDYNCPCHIPKTTEQPYDQTDHSHCWESKNPPCGQKIEHLKCCLCELPNPACAKWFTTEQQKCEHGKESWDCAKCIRIALTPKQPPVDAGEEKICTRDGTHFKGKCPNCESTNGYDAGEEWEEEFDKLWHTCQWSEKDGLHPEAFYYSPSEEGDEPHYDSINIKSFIRSLLLTEREKAEDEGYEQGILAQEPEVYEVGLKEGYKKGHLDRFNNDKIEREKIAHLRDLVDTEFIRGTKAGRLAERAALITKVEGMFMPEIIAPAPTEVPLDRLTRRLGYNRAVSDLLTYLKQL